MASSDAIPIPRKNVAYRAHFVIRDADGDLVSGAAALDSEVSKDGGTFADCTNEATEVATSSGEYFLDLTSTEMNADHVSVLIKTTTSGAKTAYVNLYPMEDADIRSNVVMWNGTAPNNLNNGLVQSDVQRWLNVVVNALISGRVDVSVGAMAANVLTAAAIATDAFSAAKFAADAIAKIADGVWDEDIVAAHGTADTAGRCLRVLDAISDRANNSNLNALLGIADSVGVTVQTRINDVEVDTQDIQTRLPAALVGGRMDSSVGAMAADVMTAAAAAADFGAEIRTGLALAADLATVHNNVVTILGAVDTEIGTILSNLAIVDGNVDQLLLDTTDIKGRLPAALVGGRMDSSVGAMTAGAVDSVWDEALVEPVGVPVIGAQVRSALAWIFALARNKIEQTATEQRLRNDLDSATIGTAPVSDAAGVFTRGKFA